MSASTRGVPVARPGRDRLGRVGLRRAGLRRAGLRRAGLRRTGLAAVAASLATALAVAGCQGAYDLPLPGGAAARGDVYRITVEFRDVLDLVPQSSVKVDQVTVGAVEEIELNGWTARGPCGCPGTCGSPTTPRPS